MLTHRVSYESFSEFFQVPRSAAQNFDEVSVGVPAKYRSAAQNFVGFFSGGGAVQIAAELRCNLLQEGDGPLANVAVHPSSGCGH